MARASVGVKAVYESDLERVLQRLGIFHDVSSGRTRCASCTKCVDLDNLGAVFSDNGEIRVSCDSPVCIRRSALALREAQTAP